MSTRKLVSALIISAEVMMLAACSSDPAVVIGSPKPVEPPATTPATAPQDKSFIWSAADGFKEIPIPSYSESMTVMGINNLGQVIGFLTLHVGQQDYRGFIWSANDGLQRLGSLVGPDGISWPLTIDDNGEVRGLSEGPSTREGGMGISISDAFVWTAGSGIKPATSTEPESFKPVSERGKLILPAGANCIQLVRTTTAGYAIGYAGAGETGFSCKPTNTVMWEVDGTPVVIGPCGARSCDITVSDINNHGEVVGTYGGWSGFRWTRSAGFVGVPIESGFVNVINDNGDAAGRVDTGAGEKPFVWMASGEIKKIELPQGATLESVAGINNNGQVIGQFR